MQKSCPGGGGPSTAGGGLGVTPQTGDSTPNWARRSSAALSRAAPPHLHKAPGAPSLPGSGCAPAVPGACPVPPVLTRVCSYCSARCASLSEAMVPPLRSAPLRSAPSRCRCRCRCPRRPRLLPDRAGRARGTARGRDRPRSASARSARHRHRQRPPGRRGARLESPLMEPRAPRPLPGMAPVGSPGVQVRVKAGGCRDHGRASRGTHRSLLPQVPGAGVGLGAASLRALPAEMCEHRAGALQAVTPRLMAMPGWGQSGGAECLRSGLA